MKKLSIILTLLLLMGGKAFAQYEFEYVFDSIKNETPCSLFYDIIELDNGDFVLHGLDLTKYYSPCLYEFSPTGELIKEKLFRNDFELPGYNRLHNNVGSPFFSDKNGGYYLFLTYNPIFDTTNINFIPDTYDAKIIMNKLDENFDVEYSKEMKICLDTVDWNILWQPGSSPPYIEIGTAFEDDGEGFIISYEKYIGANPSHLWNHGKDSTFFLKTDYDLNIIKKGFFEHERCNNLNHRNHFLYDRENDIYLYYTSIMHIGFYVRQFDSEFNLIKENVMKGTTGTGNHAIALRDEVYNCQGITLKRTSSNTTLVGSSAFIAHFSKKIYFAGLCFEINDNAKLIDSMEFARDNGYTSTNKTAVPSGCSIDYFEDNKIFFGVTPHAWFSHGHFPEFQYFVLRSLDRNLNTTSEMYYDMGVDSTALWINTLKATRDGGCIIAGHFRNYVENPHDNHPIAFHSVVKKFPPEAFNGIEEAHDNGLKVAFAYPNPGNNVLNIRTALPDSHVEVYDANGKLVFNQDITDIVTSIDVEKWSSGIYVWKVVSDGKEAETGKWVRE